MPATYRYSFFSRTPATENGKWLYLLPTIAVGAVGAACIPHFALGLGIGMCQFIVNYSLSTILNRWMSLPPTERNSIYENQLREGLTWTTLVGPVFEELLFRGILQPLLLLTIGALFSLSPTELFSKTTVDILLYLFCCQTLGSLHLGLLVLLLAVLAINLPPLISIAMFGASINAASLGVVCVTAILFGAIHLPNEHQNAPVQAMVATLSGVIFGLLALQYGLWVPIAAHIMNNTLSITSLLLGDEFSEQEQAATMPYNVA